MDPKHETPADPGRGTPIWFTAAAWILPAGLLGQFLSAGAALFLDAALWHAHVATGGMMALPVVALVAGSLVLLRLRQFRWWAGLIAGLYLVQIALAAGATPLGLSLHPFNGALLLVASLVLLARVARRRGQPVPAGFSGRGRRDSPGRHAEDP